MTLEVQPHARVRSWGFLTHTLELGGSPDPKRGWAVTAPLIWMRWCQPSSSFPRNPLLEKLTSMGPSPKTVCSKVLTGLGAASVVPTPAHFGGEACSSMFFVFPGRCSSLQKAGSACHSTTAASPTWWSGQMAEWRSGPLGTRGSCLRTRSPAPEGCLEALLSSVPPVAPVGAAEDTAPSPSSPHRLLGGLPALQEDGEKVPKNVVF